MTTPILTYYGDDLTGSTDVMESLGLACVPTVLFMRQPEQALLARFAECRAIGLAGTSRSQSPEWMDANLPAALSWLKQLGAEICHYKVCSTFDSSPTTGNIGRAIEIGRQVFAQKAVPLIVGAPQLKRYTAFGHLFAAYQGSVYRIDRHPVMSRHPVTPMAESDLGIHLSHQTALKTELVDLATLKSAGRSEAVDALFAGDADIVLFDVDDRESQKLAGTEVWRLHDRQGTFVAGSSGIEYALLAEWAAQGIVPGTAEFAPAPAVERMAVVSGSCSPTTARQIRHALDNGFDDVALDPMALVSSQAGTAIEASIASGLASLSAGRSVILYTALGPDTDRGADIRDGQRNDLGRSLGTILAALVRQAGLTRAVIAGGDTSSHALGELGVDALTMRRPLPQSPGSPLCVAHSADPASDGLEIALKGGQVGLDSYFSAIRDGTF